MAVAPTDREARPTARALRAALANACPNCGDHAFFVRALEPHEQCPRCGVDFTRYAAGDGAVFIVMTALCILVVGIVVALELLIGPPLWVHALTAVVLCGALVAVLLPVVKRFLVAQAFLLGADGDAVSALETRSDR